MKISSVLFFGVTLLSAATSIASAEDKVLFYGGSSMERWTQGGLFDADFAAPDFVHSRSIIGYRGAKLDELKAKSTDDVWNHKPRVVVFYGGENDIAAANIPVGATPIQIDQLAESVLTSFKAFVTTRNETDSKKSAILFVSIKPSMDFFYKVGLPTATNADEFVSPSDATPLMPARAVGPTTGPAATAAQAAESKLRRDAAWQANTKIHNWINSEMQTNPQRNLYYFSIWQDFLAEGKESPSNIEDDKPNPLYFEDATHPTWQGFDQWAKVITPRINRIWDKTAPVS